LFYGVLGGVLHFASEIKAFAASPAWDGTIDVSQLEEYLTLGYFLAPGTAYKHVRKLQPGHWLRLKNGNIETRRYWNVEQFDDDNRSERTILDEIEATIAVAVRERLESEVPLGAFLSGGIDSGLVVSFMAEAAAREVITTSVRAATTSCPPQR
jgi:asparagine synthase (glutamine-hydrolysing)